MTNRPSVRRYTACTPDILMAFFSAPYVSVLPSASRPCIQCRTADIFWGVVGTRCSLHTVALLFSWTTVKLFLWTICSWNSWRVFLLINDSLPSIELDVSITITTCGWVMGVVVGGARPYLIFQYSTKQFSTSCFQPFNSVM